MATPEELLALAERVEKAEGPDRELDILIGAAIDLDIGCGISFANSLALQGMPDMLRLAESYQHVWREGLPRYTASLDAAMSLVPGGWLLAELSERNCSLPNWRWKAALWNPETGQESEGRARGCDHAAPAICAASLRARAANATLKSRAGAL